MAGFVQRYHDIALSIEDVPPEGRLFCFFAFDERPSHRIVLDFLADSGEWLDHLSASSGVFTFIFVKKWVFSDDSRWGISQRAYTTSEIKSMQRLDGKTVYINPTIELAKQFGVPPSKLPGLFIFESLESQQDLSIAFIPLELDNFADRNAAETTIAAIYSCINTTLASLGKNERCLWRETLSKNLKAILKLETNKLEPKSRTDICEFLRTKDLDSPEDIIAYDPQQKGLKGFLNTLKALVVVNTGGGAYIAGNVDVSGNFVGRDMAIDAREEINPSEISSPPGKMSAESPNHSVTDE